MFKRTTFLFALFIALFFVYSMTLKYYPDFLWFKDLGYLNIFTYNIKSKISVFFIGFGIAFFILYLNLLIADSILKRINKGNKIIDLIVDNLFKINGPGYDPVAENIKQTIKKYTNILYFVAISFISLIFGGLVALSNWQTIILFLNKTQSTILDPIYGKSLDFYFFTLPFMNSLLSFLLTIFFFAIISLLFVYFQFGLLRFSLSVFKEKSTKAQILILSACVFFILALKFYFSRYGMLINTTGKLFNGPGFTDVNTGILNYYVLSALCALIGVILIIEIFTSSLKPLIFGLGILLVSGFLFGNILPSIVQKFIVNPNEFQKEKPFITNNIKYTRLAYNLDKIKEKPYSAQGKLNTASIIKNQDIINNIRLWNEEPIQRTFAQLQEIRLYYEFSGVDVDRYMINGKEQQVMLAARELIPDQLSDKAQNWVNRKLQYTHGYGLVMSPVNKLTSEGMPEFFIKDIPPVSTIDLPIKRPEIYFGEKKQ